MGGIGGGGGFALFLPFINLEEKNPDELGRQFQLFAIVIAAAFTGAYAICLLIYRAKPPLPPT